MPKNLQIKNKILFRNSLIIAVLVTSFDLISKVLMFNFLDNHGGYVEVLPFFNLAKVYNTGVSFGMFNELASGKYILATIATIIMFGIIYWLSKEDEKIVCYPLGFVIGGAAGNTIDRLINGAVADFLDFHIANNHWPAFNVADSFITIGAMILIYDELVLKRKKKNA